jgi:hypothetical protein
MTPYYDHAGITIYHGDCRDILPHVTADCVVTDPPYGVLAETGSAATRRSWGNKDNGRIAWDVAPTNDLLGQLTNRTCMVWGGCHLALPQTFGYLVWDKQIDGLNFGEVEFCWTNLRFAPRVFRYRAVGVDGGKLHPTQKPVALMRWCLSFVPEGTILDPFMGSGTTLVAAKQLGRKAIGIEIDERYCEVAAKRLGQEVLPLNGLGNEGDGGQQSSLWDPEDT